MRLGFMIVALVSCFQTFHTYKILLITNFPSPSHYFLVNTLAKELANVGHDVLIISPYTEKKPPRNGTYREIVITRTTEVIEGMKNVLFEMEKMNKFKLISTISKLGITFTEVTLEDPKIHELLASDEKFDVVIAKQFHNDALKAFAHHYKCPLITFSTLGPNNWINHLVGNPSPPSYIPELMLSYRVKMTFLEKVINFIFRNYEDLHRHYIFLPLQNEIMKSYFPDAPDLDVLYFNSSIVLVNSHESISQAVPLVPSMIPIGGFHISPPKNLSMDLQQYLDNAKEGVIYFSMGSNIKPSEMKNETITALLATFGKLDMKVLWKWDEELLWGKPENVRISKWFPQTDILAHPNVKLFITHGGLLSLTETVYHGIPILALPLYGDQKWNAQTAEDAEIGLKIDYNDITEEKLTKYLEEILHNPKYRENVKRKSLLLHDRPMKPLDLAIYWIEYVARHKGAQHLKLASLDMPWYKYLCLDVIGVLLLVVSFVCYLLLNLLIYIITVRHKSIFLKIKLH